MDKCKIVFLFIRYINKNYCQNKLISKSELDNVVDPSSLVRYSGILIEREKAINIYNVCSVAEHIINIRSLLLNYNAFFMDLHELFNKLFIKINVFKARKKLISNFKKNNEPMQNLKTIFSFVNKLGFFLDNSNISKEEIESFVSTIDLIESTLDNIILKIETIDYENIDQVKRSLRLCALQFEHCQELSLKLIKFTEKILDQLDLDSCD